MKIHLDAEETLKDHPQWIASRVASGYLNDVVSPVAQKVIRMLFYPVSLRRETQLQVDFKNAPITFQFLVRVAINGGAYGLRNGGG